MPLVSRVASCRLRSLSDCWPLRGLDLYHATFDAWGCDSVYVERLDDAVAARLVDEFGEDGRRCVEFLETAHVLLCGGFRSVPRWGQTVAYCLREAMTAVLEAARLGDAGRWREVSRGVVEPLAGSIGGWSTTLVLRGIGCWVSCWPGSTTWRRFTARIELRRRRLNDVMVNLTGAAPISARVSPD